MASPEVQELRVPETEGTKTGAQETTVSEEKLSEEAATELVNNLLDNSDVFEAFKALQTIEKKYKANALPENIKNIYVKARNEALKQLKNEPVFKELGGTLDTDSNIEEDISLSGLSEEAADSIVTDILGNHDELQKQNNNIMRVENNTSILNDPQRKLYYSIKKEIEKGIEEDPYLQGKLKMLLR